MLVRGVRAQLGPGSNKFLITETLMRTEIKLAGHESAQPTRSEHPAIEMHEIVAGKARILDPCTISEAILNGARYEPIDSQIQSSNHFCRDLQGCELLS